MASSNKTSTNIDAPAAESINFAEAKQIATRMRSMFRDFEHAATLVDAAIAAGDRVRSAQAKRDALATEAVELAVTIENRKCEHAEMVTKLADGLVTAQAEHDRAVAAMAAEREALVAELAVLRQQQVDAENVLAQFKAAALRLGR
jgi:hypothetical protein